MPDEMLAHLTLPRSIPSLFTVKDLRYLASSFHATRRCLITPFLIPCQSLANFFLPIREADRGPLLSAGTVRTRPILIIA